MLSRMPYSLSGGARFTRTVTYGIAGSLDVCRQAMRALLDLISNKIDGAKSDLEKIRNKDSAGSAS